MAGNHTWLETQPGQQRLRGARLGKSSSCRDWVLNFPFPVPVDRHTGDVWADPPGALCGLFAVRQGDLSRKWRLLRGFAYFVVDMSGLGSQLQRKFQLLSGLCKLQTQTFALKHRTSRLKMGICFSRQQRTLPPPMGLCLLRNKNTRTIILKLFSATGRLGLRRNS